MKNKGQHLDIEYWHWCLYICYLRIYYYIYIWIVSSSIRWLHHQLGSVHTQLYTQTHLDLYIYRYFDASYVNHCGNRARNCAELILTIVRCFVLTIFERLLIAMESYPLDVNSIHFFLSIWCVNTGSFSLFFSLPLSLPQSLTFPLASIEKTHRVSLKERSPKESFIEWNCEFFRLIRVEMSNFALLAFKNIPQIKVSKCMSILYVCACVSHPMIFDISDLMFKSLVTECVFKF